MRVIAGRLGGRNFASPRGHRTHPMSDKMRGALFGVLGDIASLTVLDVFAGSGALSFEAISRGAAVSLAIDNDKTAYATLQSNIELLGLGEYVHATRAYFNAWSTRHQAQQFDLVLADPPYDALSWRDIDKLPRHLKTAGTLVISWPGKTEAPRFSSLRPVEQRGYGDSQLIFYQLPASEEIQPSR